MSEHYPRIYSLSTLNLKQHFNCDYRFHEFRTDFSGESGSGKSMIADFIQLLLVGSGVFRSGTEAIGDREVSGLVAGVRGSKYGRGYLLMNVLTAPQKYVTLGSYLETTSGHMQSFVISKSYNLTESLEPLDEPVFYRDLLIDDQIEAVDILQQRILEKGYLRALPLGKYHRLLYESGILAVDLSQSKQSLASFAAIIRSFSRGKGYFNKSAALKTFLFGDDDHNKLLERYHEEVGQIKLDQSQHDQLIAEIDQIRDKQEQIVNVTSRFREFQRLRQRFSQESASFWQQRLDESLGNMTKAEQTHRETKLRRIVIQQKGLNTSVRDIETQHRDWSSLQNAVRLAEANNLTWERREREAKAELEQSSKFKTMIDQVKAWLSGERSDLDAVRSWYAAQKQKLTDKESLRQFEQYLDERSLRVKFESSAWYQEPATGRQVTQTALDLFDFQEQQLQTRLTFTDFNDPASLGSWALEHLSLPLSLEQESLLVHFQKLERTAPAIPAGRYLAMPEALFPNPATSPANETGFWVDLWGIYEFIPFVSDQLLNVPRSELKLVELSREELQAKLTAVSEKKQQLQYLQDQLTAFSGLEHNIRLYHSAASSLFEEPDEISELTSTVFERHLQAYETRETYLVKFSKDEQAYEAAHQQFMSGRSSGQISAAGSKKITEYMQQQYGSTDFDALITKKRLELAEWDEALNALLENQELSVKDVQQAETVLFASAPRPGQSL
jgi:exonuclease SbcC